MVQLSICRSNRNILKVKSCYMGQQNCNLLCMGQELYFECLYAVPYLYCKMLLTILWFSRHLDDYVNTDWMIEYIDLWTETSGWVKLFFFFLTWGSVLTVFFYYCSIYREDLLGKGFRKELLYYKYLERESKELKMIEWMPLLSDVWGFPFYGDQLKL